MIYQLWVQTSSVQYMWDKFLASSFIFLILLPVSLLSILFFESTNTNIRSSSRAPVPWICFYTGFSWKEWSLFGTCKIKRRWNICCCAQNRGLFRNTGNLHISKDPYKKEQDQILNDYYKWVALHLKCEHFSVIYVKLCIIWS